MPKNRIILIRHGEASLSWQNSRNPGLSDLGNMQARSVAEMIIGMNTENFSIISSPKKRALETARPLAYKTQKKITIDETFTEIPSENIPNAEKMSWLKEIFSTDNEDLPGNISEWKNNIIKKILNFSKPKIIFTHFVVINVIISFWKKKKFIYSCNPEYTSITNIITNDGIIMDITLSNDRKTHINV